MESLSNEASDSADVAALKVEFSAVAAAPAADVGPDALPSSPQTNEPCSGALLMRTKQYVPELCGAVKHRIDDKSKKVADGELTKTQS